MPAVDSSNLHLIRELDYELTGCKTATKKNTTGQLAAWLCVVPGYAPSCLGLCPLL